MRALALLLLPAVAVADTALPAPPPGAHRVVTTPSGLRYIDLKVGTGPAPIPGGHVELHYVGTFPDGRPFDSSLARGPARFPIGRAMLIPGFEEGVLSMRVGGKRKLMIPPHLGYGTQGARGVIPPGAEIHFTVELLAISPR